MHHFMLFLYLSDSECCVSDLAFCHSFKQREVFYQNNTDMIGNTAKATDIVVQGKPESNKMKK